MLHKHKHKLPDLTIKTEGVEKLLKSIVTPKACGPDNIPNIILNNCAVQLATGLRTIFQLSVDNRTLPKDWLNANVSPVFKKGDVHMVENYWPVSLTSVSCKLLQHIICKHLLDHLEKNKILTNLNHGFRAGYPCETQLLTILSETSKPPLDIFSYILTYMIHTWLKFTLNMEKSIKQNLSKFHFHELKITCSIDRLYKGTIAFYFHTNARI